jgi:hypothetical protein
LASSAGTVPPPEPASDDPARNTYIFERRVEIRHPDGSVTKGYIDLYYRQHFVLEAKQTSQALETRYAVERVAGFLMQCLFTMFAEDVEWLRLPGLSIRILLTVYFGGSRRGVS